MVYCRVKMYRNRNRIRFNGEHLRYDKCYRNFGCQLKQVIILFGSLEDRCDSVNNTIIGFHICLCYCGVSQHAT